MIPVFIVSPVGFGIGLIIAIVIYLLGYCLVGIFAIIIISCALLRLGLHKLLDYIIEQLEIKNETPEQRIEREKQKAEKEKFQKQLREVREWSWRNHC